MGKTLQFPLWFTEIKDISPNIAIFIETAMKLLLMSWFGLILLVLEPAVLPSKVSISEDEVFRGIFSVLVSLLLNLNIFFIFF